jgi:regulator of RNase E activity RraA
MSNTLPTAAQLAALTKLDTPTICNALEIAAPERRGYGYTVKPLVACFPDMAPMVGFARTATCRAMRPTSRDKAVVRKQRFEYFDYLATGGPLPAISIVQDLDGPNAGFGAFWGEVQTNIHKSLGCLGTITDGSVRDIPMMAPGFQVLAGSIGPSHAFTHLVEFGVDVVIHGMQVASNDLVHADRHGAAIIPLNVVQKVLDAADLLARREAVILDVCKAPGFTVEKLKQAIGAADEIH